MLRHRDGPSRATVVLAGLAVLVAAGTAFAAGRHVVDWWVVSGGGGTMRSDRYALSGTIGEFSADTSETGRHRIDGGFWPGAVVTERLPTPLPRTATPTATATGPTPGRTPTASRTPPRPTGTASVAASPTPTRTPRRPTGTASLTPAPPVTPTRTATRTPVASPIATDTATAGPPPTWTVYLPRVVREAPTAAAASFP